MRPDAVRRVLYAELAAARDRRAGEPPRVLDVGGGSGVWAVPLAAAGCAVTVVDPSPNALATLHRRAQEAGVVDSITALQGDSDALAQLIPAGSVDLVLGHGVLEVVDDPKTTIAAMAEATAPGGLVSVLVANRYAAILHRAISGRIVEARRLLDDPAGQLVEETLSRRYDITGLNQLLVDGGLKVELVQGHGVFSDLVPGSVLDSNPGAAEALAQLELAASTTSPLLDVAARLHALGRR
ncbi:class I SAM-dependent methyltransferase [Kibdelosporangium aridum]|uniref:Methyltransferase domain-containing protein n=1 Tax=Kibdelosporangium aridum TaxID=2030 RepID=A0A1W2END8_KIBAR|nr:methyltransferase domain-containing protein [Kibdelosporangium aridum]SMD10806.1 Methyltransferase domain-containing protein [Kibdelosporangium aridum]